MKNFQQWFEIANFDNIKHRDIALKEYETCFAIMKNGENVFNNLIKYIIGFWTIMTWLIANSNYKILFENISKYDKNLQLIILTIIILIFFILLTPNFAAKQKNVVFAKRKIILLRKMLGIDYSHQQLILTKNEIYGENNPFNIKLKFDINFSLILTLFGLSVVILGGGYTKNRYNFYFALFNNRYFFVNGAIFILYRTTNLAFCCMCFKNIVCRTMR